MSQMVQRRIQRIFICTWPKKNLQIGIKLVNIHRAKICISRDKVCTSVDKNHLLHFQECTTF